MEDSFDFIDIKDLARQTGIPVRRIRKLIKDGLPAKKVKFEMVKKRKIAYGVKKSKIKKEKTKIVGVKWLIDYQKWFEIPTFIRNSWVKYTPKK